MPLVQPVVTEILELLGCCRCLKTQVNVAPGDMVSGGLGSMGLVAELYIVRGLFQPEQFSEFSECPHGPCHEVLSPVSQMPLQMSHSLFPSLPQV